MAPNWCHNIAKIDQAKFDYVLISLIYGFLGFVAGISPQLRIRLGGIVGLICFSALPRTSLARLKRLDMLLWSGTECHNIGKVD